MTGTGAPARFRSPIQAFWNGLCRALIVLIGGLLVLQASSGLDGPKIVYLLVAGVATLGSVVAVWRARLERVVIEARPWLVSSVVLAFMIAASLPVAIAHGTPTSSWMRDAATYALLAAAPWVGVDLARSATPRQVALVAMVTALLAAASFVIEWLPRRGLGVLPISRLTLPSHPLGSMGYAVAFSLGVLSRGTARLVWLLVATAVLVAFLVTGTRTTAVILAAPLAVYVANACRRGLLPSRDIAAAGLIQVVVVVAFFTAFGPTRVGAPGAGGTPESTGSDRPASPTAPAGAPATSQSTPEPTASQGKPVAAPASARPAKDLGERFGTLDDILSGRDSSLRDRVAQTQAAWEAFVSSPLLGVGLGFPFTWASPGSRPVQAFTLDTPLVLVAKFGLPAILLCLLIATAFLSTARASLRRYGWSWRVFTLLAVGAVFVALLPFGWPPEDKGASFSLLLLLGLVLARGTDPPGIESGAGDHQSRPARLGRLGSSPAARLIGRR